MSKRALEKMSSLNDLFGAEEESTAPALMSINKIVRPKTQPRRHFDEEKLESLAKSISDVGLLEPIVVRSLGDDSYELIAGERRLRACQKLGMKEIIVNVIDCDENTANRVRLVENLQREDLNLYEETVGVLELLATLLERDEHDVVRLLHRMHEADKGKISQNILGGEDSTLIQDTFVKLGKVTWQTFLTTRLPMLKLKDDIKEVLASGQLEYSKAIAISKIKDDEKRAPVLKQAVDEKLPLSKIKELIEKANATTTQQEKVTLAPKDANSRLNKVNKLLKDSRIWDNPQQVQQLSKYLSQIEKLLSSVETIPE